MHNQYGITTSRLHGGLPTDRCIAEWWIDSPRVHAVLGGAGHQRRRVAERIAYPVDIAGSASTIPPARAKSNRPTPAFSSTPSRADWPSPASSAPTPKAPTFWHHGNETRPHHPPPDPHAAGALLRNQLQPHLRAATSFWWKSIGDGLSGWGEVTAGENPFYNEEWTASVWLILRDYVAPRVLGHDARSAAEDVFAATAHIRGHNMARGGLEAAVWDLEARRARRPAVATDRRRRAHARFPAASRSAFRIRSRSLLEKIETELAAGYQRIKMKIKPGWDIDVVRQVRERFPTILLMADANSAYTLADTDHLRKLDEFYLMMIEQPLAHDDIIDHAMLQAQLQTPICLDECIRTAHHAEQAIALHACGIINIKLGRVGGFQPGQTDPRFRPGRTAFRCGAAACWRPASAAPTISRSSTLPNFVLPGDVSASKRYWKRDIIQPAG